MVQRLRPWLVGMVCSAALWLYTIPKKFLFLPPNTWCVYTSADEKQSYLRLGLELWLCASYDVEAELSPFQERKILCLNLGVVSFFPIININGK